MRRLRPGGRGLVLPKGGTLARSATLVLLLSFATPAPAALVGGKNLPSTPEEIVKLREKALQGDAVAAQELGDIHTTGRGVLPDPHEAEQWYRIAVDLGEKSATSRLGGLLVATSGEGEGDERRAEGLRILREAVDDSASQIALGLYHVGGAILERDIEAATARFQAAADLGDPAGFYRLGWLHSGEAGMPGEIRPTQALAWLEKGFQAGHVESGLLLVRLLQEGRRVPRDDAKALRLLEAGAARGEATAVFLLALAHEAGRGVAPNPGRAVELAREAASQGNGEAQNQLGLWHVRGWEAAGLARDPAEAQAWFEKAAEVGLPAAHYNLAMLHDAREEPSAGPAAVAHLVQAAASGFGEAQDRLGSWYRDGRHVVADPVAAEGWFRRAVSGGQISSFINLGRLLESRAGNPEVQREARELYRRAAAAGHPAAHFFLARVLVAGVGGVPDAVAAHAHLAAAAKAGLAPAQELLPEVERRLTPEQLKDSERIRGSLKVVE